MDRMRRTDRPGSEEAARGGSLSDQGTAIRRRPHPRATRLGVLAVLVAVTGWAFTNIVVKLTVTPGLTFTFYRLWLGTAAMLLAVTLARRTVTWSMVRKSAPAGVMFGVNVALFVSALKLTSVADVLIIQALQPALTLMVAGRLFGERITRWDVAWTLTSIGGVVLVTIGSSGTPVWSLRGDLLAVGALMVWTVYFLVSKRVRRDVPAVQYMTIVTVIAALISTPIVLLSGQPLGGVRWQDWAWLGAFLVAAQGGHVLVAWAHAQVDVSISTLLILAQPVIAVTAAHVILDEPLPVMAVAGGLIVILAVAAIIRRATRAGEEVATSETPPA